MTSGQTDGARDAAPIGPAQGYLRIATEEAFAPPEMFKLYRDLLARRACDDPGFVSLWGFYLGSSSPRARAIIRRLQDLGDERLHDMDCTGIDRQIVSLTSPGVQVFDAATAVSLARAANDVLAEACRRHPHRYTGLTAVSPQDPRSAVQEIERGQTKLGFKGVIINSHTRGEYLDDRKFWDIFETCAALDTPIYLHPNTPSARMIAPLLEAGLDGAIYGFGVETGMHLLRIIVSGVFDRFPALKIVVGHLGEALPFWLFRLDYMHRATVLAQRYPNVRPLERQISDYLRENVYVTSSGMAWAPAILFCQQVLGVDRVLYAMDYPYQFVADEVRATDAVPMSDADRKKFYQTNAESVFRL